MASLPNRTLRDFSEVQQELDDVTSRLKKSFEPKTRARILRELRLLLEEADLLIEQSANCD